MLTRTIHRSARASFQRSNCSLSAQSLTGAFSAPPHSQYLQRCRSLQTAAATTPGTTPRDYVPLRKQLKDEAKAKKGKKKGGNGGKKDAREEKWELTVGIEIHAQLNTDCKLFSRAATSLNAAPNSHVSVFDLAFPGSQPEFQKATLIPALRAAIAMDCDIQRTSRFDRKHYFYQDQPAGYQITQYYEPFAKSGSITLYPHDGIDARDYPSIKIGLKQIQMEQDTAKSTETSPGTHLLDFNRVSHPLIEVITLPEIHHPATAAACVRKIQAILQSVGAVTTGMEMGGLRADVNVSVRRRDGADADAIPSQNSYSGISGLGQRTEIKNLSSFKAVEDAIIAERNRQIAVLEDGGVIEGETRGWTIGSTETRRLRGKEGEVDYRYMPDPDLGPVIIGEDLINHLRGNLPLVPDELLTILTDANQEYNLNPKDAKPLIELDDGARLDYYIETITALNILITASTSPNTIPSSSHPARTTANFLLHELGGHIQTTQTPFSENPITPSTFASLIYHLLTSQITNRTAKSLLAMLFSNPDETRSIAEIIDDEKLRLIPMTDAAYMELARGIMEDNEAMIGKVRAEGEGSGKIGWFVGQMVRGGEEGRVEASRAEEVVRGLLFGERK